VGVRDAWIAAAAAGFATVGDLLMLYAANAPRPELALPPAPEGALLAGGLLGVAAIPLYAFGYRAAARLAGDGAGSRRRGLAEIGVMIAVLGASIHGLTAFLIADDLSAGAPPRDPLAAITAWGLPILVLWMVAALLVLIASVHFSAGVVRARSSGPRGLALATPALLTMLLALPGLGSPLGAAFLTPAAPNVAHGLFFLACAITEDRSRRQRRVD
jgi:hypothetical protein